MASKKNEITVRIFQPGKYFLYLPLYYAYHVNFFGLVPKRYKVTFVEKETDKKAYDALIAERDGNADFAVCDPVELFLDKDRAHHHPIILASLITNSSFWAISKKKTGFKMKSLKDMASFDKIIAFKDGTTSNRIAKRIIRDAIKKITDSTADPVELKEKLIEGKLATAELLEKLIKEESEPAKLVEKLIEEITKVKLESVDPGNEFDKLKPDVVVLTPDLLGVVKLDERERGVYNRSEGYDIFPLGTTPEYNNVLVTALLSRGDVVKNKEHKEHKELVAGLLKAIQRAALLVRFADPKVVKYAADNDDFGFETPRDCIGSALRKAADDQVFPSSIEVSKAHWINAVRTAVNAEGRAFDDPAYSSACDVYQDVTKHYQDNVRDAIHEDILLLLKWAFGFSGIMKRIPAIKWTSIAIFVLGIIGAAIESRSPRISKVYQAWQLFGK